MEFIESVTGDSVSRKMVIIDTSVGFKWFDALEKYRDEAMELLEKHLVGEQNILVPDLFLYEITNAWSTKSVLTIEAVHQNLAKLEEYRLRVESVTFPMLQHASEFSKSHHVSVYDASYAVLAQEKECDLITADVKFIRQVNLPCVKLLGD